MREVGEAPVCQPVAGKVVIAGGNFQDNRRQPVVQMAVGAIRFDRGISKWHGILREVIR